MLTRRSALLILVNLAILGIFVFWLVTMSLVVTFLVEGRTGLLVLFASLLTATAGSIALWGKETSDKWLLIVCSLITIPGYIYAAHASYNLFSKIWIIGLLFLFLVLSAIKLSITKYSKDSK